MTDIGTVCSRGVCVSRRGDALADAAKRMLNSHVGALVVVDPEIQGLRPIGIVTDRDIVVGQLDSARDLFCLTVEDVMTSDVLSLDETCGIAEAIGYMSRRSVRRAPVVDKDGNLVGMVTIDDLLPALAKSLGAIALLVNGQSHREGR